MKKPAWAVAIITAIFSGIIFSIFFWLLVVHLNQYPKAAIQDEKTICIAQPVNRVSKNDNDTVKPTKPEGVAIVGPVASGVVSKYLEKLNYYDICLLILMWGSGIFFTNSVARLAKRALDDGNDSA